MLYVTHTHTHISFFPDTPAFCLGTRSTPTILEQSLTDLSKLFSPPPNKPSTADTEEWSGPRSPIVAAFS